MLRTSKNALIVKVYICKDSIITEVDGVKKSLSGNKISSKLIKSKKLVKHNFIFGARFFIFKAKVVFAKLRKTFIETLIFHYFDPE